MSASAPAFLRALLCAGLSLSSLAAEQVQPPTPAASQWDYDSYRKAYPDQVCRSVSSQSGRKEMQAALKFARAGEAPTRSNAELRKRLLETWRDLLGPSSRNNGPLELKVLEEKNFSAYTRKKIQYTGDPGEPIRAWLFLPKGDAKPHPAMLCLHQTAQSGKDQASGVDQVKPELAFGPLLAERGFVALCPDAICFGERYQVGGNFYCHYGDAVRIYKAQPGRSILSKMVDDAMRAVDVLESMPQVDKKRIGCIGHSHGGYGTLFAMAYDTRIAAGVVSCGFSCFRSDPTPERWYRRTALVPRLGNYEGHMQDTPVDFHHLFAAVSPRPLFISAALKDRIFPHLGDTQWIERDTKQVYARDHAAEAFELFSFDGEHAFTPEVTARAWVFLDKHLQH